MSDPASLQARVSRLLNHSPFAVLTTVGSDSRPHARWMTPVLVTGNLDEVDCLVLPGSRKMRHVLDNPHVTWLYQSPSFDEVVTVHGQAWVEKDLGYRSLVWDRMPEKQRVLFFRSPEPTGFEVLRTRVERIEYIQPLSGELKPTLVPFEAAK